MRTNLPAILTLVTLAAAVTLIVASWARYGWLLGMSLVFLELQCLLALSASGKLTMTVNSLLQQRQPAGGSPEGPDFQAGPELK